MKKIIEIYNSLPIFRDKKNNIKRLVLLIILFPFFVFYLQQVKPYFKLSPLKGYFIPTSSYAKPTNASWFSGEYQRTTNDFLNENFGFRNFFVRLHNQLRFLLFNRAQVEGVIIGKENYLYEIGYIDTYYGKFYMGQQAIRDTINNLKFLQDTLKTLGKELLVVIAPSKARVYPEFIPDYLVKKEKAITNYEFLYKGFKKAGIQFIDFNALFLEKKKTSPYLLFPKLGVHWSRLEAVKAADTIINYLASISNSDLPRIKIKKITELDTLQPPDNDIIDGMNIFFYPKHQKMAYPEITIDKKNKAKRNLMVISDSYWWDIYLREIPKNVFENNEFWYYNNELFGNKYLGKTDPKKVDVKRHILQSDYIVLMCTESNLSRLGFGFIGNAIKAIRTPISPSPRELNDIKKVILNSKAWYEQIKSKAKERQLNLDSMITLDANWYFQHKGPVHQEVSIDEVKASIRINDSWMKEVIAKAHDRKISVDSMMTEDALWFMANVLHATPEKQKTAPTVADTKNMIIHNNEWMKEIRNKAKKRNLSVDSMMTLDAIWYLENHK